MQPIKAQAKLIFANALDSIGTKFPWTQFKKNFTQ
jgi:hypothetical protein